jgi:hypothetical protein
MIHFCYSFRHHISQFFVAGVKLVKKMDFWTMGLGSKDFWSKE